MVQCRSRKRVVLIPAILLLVFAAGSGVAAAQTNDNSLRMVPSESLFCVRINNLDTALGQVDMFLSSVMPLNVSMQVKGQLGQLLGSSNAAGVNTSGSFTVFGPLPGAGDPTQIGILVPVSNYEQFVSSNANVSAANASGVSTLGLQGRPMASVTQVGDYALMTPANGTANLSQAKQALSASTRGLAGALDSAELERATSSPVWAYGNVQLAGRMFGPMIQAQLAQAKTMFEGMEAQGQPQMASAKGAIDMYSAIIDSVLKESRYVSLALEPSASKISAGLVLASVPGTAMADMLQAAPTKPENNLMGYLGNDAAIYFSGSMKTPFWLKANEASLNMLPMLTGATVSQEDLDAFKKLTLESTSAFAGPIAGSMSADPQGKPPFQIQYVAATTDPAMFYQVLGQASKMMSSGPIADLYASMGIKFTLDVERDAETYKGVPITTMKFDMTPTDANSPEAAVLDTLYGNGFNVRIAATDGLLAYVLAEDSDPIIHELIDKIKAGAPGSGPAQMQTGMQLIPGSDKADFFVTYNLLQVAKLGLSMNPMPLPIPMPNVPSQSQTGMAIAGNVANGKIMVDVALPPQQVSQMIQWVTAMQMQQMQNSMQDN